jgi:DNA-binding IclR family transcriptional regulator
MRLVSVLACFDATHPKQRLSDIAKRCDLPVSTAHRLLNDLCNSGLAERDGAGNYSGGIRLWQLGALATRPATLTNTAMPFMQDLYEATHENVHLGVVDGTDVLYLAKLYGRASFPIPTAPGCRVPWSPSGIGKAIVAFDASLSERLLQTQLVRLTAMSITDPAAMREELQRVREQGHAFNSEEMSVGTFSVAAPIFDWSQRPIAAISVTSHKSRAGLPRLVPAVKTVAGIISRSLPPQIFDEILTDEPSPGRV